MGFIRNILAVIGLVFIIGLGFFAVKVSDKLEGFDHRAGDLYLNMMGQLLETKDIVETMVFRVQVQEGLTPEEVETSMMAVAGEYNFAMTGIFLLGEDIEAKTEKPFRFIKIFTYCHSRTAAHMLDHSDAYSAAMPCRIALLEDQQGKLWLYTMDMDPMIYGGAPLPTELRNEAERVWGIMQEIMYKGATGDF